MVTDCKLFHRFVATDTKYFYSSDIYSKAPYEICGTVVNYFLVCLVCDHMCLISYEQMLRPCGHRNIFVSLLSIIDFQCYDHMVSHETVTFLSHNVLRTYEYCVLGESCDFVAVLGFQKVLLLYLHHIH